jgi:hypothetical protein
VSIHNKKFISRILEILFYFSEMSAEINGLASTSHKTTDESQNDKQNEENEMAAMPSSSTNDKKKSRKRKIKRFIFNNIEI